VGRQGAGLNGGGWGVVTYAFLTLQDSGKMMGQKKHILKNFKKEVANQDRQTWGSFLFTGGAGKIPVSSIENGKKKLTFHSKQHR